VRAIEVGQFGGPGVLVIRDVPDPVPGPGEVVVDVAVADVLWVETMIRRGRALRTSRCGPVPARRRGGRHGALLPVLAWIPSGWAGGS
jgi:NADPH2:quinone reductase